MAKNPLRIDPSRTALIRRAWAADMQRRFDRVKRKVYRHVNSDLTVNYDPEEERDDAGRWTSGKILDNPSRGELRTFWRDVKRRLPKEDEVVRGIIDTKTGKHYWASGEDYNHPEIADKIDPMGRTGFTDVWLDKAGQISPGMSESDETFAKFLKDAKKHKIPLTVNAPFVFKTDPAKLKKFNRWLQQQINDDILEANPVTGEPKGQKPWLYKYIDSAYKKGALRSYFDLHKPTLGKKQAFYEGTREQFLASAFGRGERTDKLRLLYARTYEDLKGVTSAMATQMSRTLADGMAHGKGPMAIARTMSNSITGITKKRARVIARTETINAHAEGQLDGLEDLGVTEVSAEVEFLDSGDNGVCPKCKALNGRKYSIAKARGVIPVHPNCRCAWIGIV